jgi:hypothetical protein
MMCHHRQRLSDQVLVTERPIALPFQEQQGRSATMATDQECVDYARECGRLAELTKDCELRTHLLNLAREWMATAMQSATHRS